MTVPNLFTTPAIRAGGWPSTGVVVAVAVTLLGSTAAGGRGAADGAHGDDDRRERSRAGAVWVVNRDAGTLAVFGAIDGALLMPPVAVGRGAHDVCVSEPAGKAFITAEADNAVTVVDLDTLATTSIPVAPLPHHCEASHDGRTLYVSLASHIAGGTHAPRYAAIDIGRPPYAVEYVATSSDGAARAHGVTPSIDGKTVYVSHDVGGQVTSVDGVTQDITFINAVARAEESVPSRFGRWLWVSGRGDDTVKRIDLVTHAMIEVPVGREPESIMLTPSERTLVASLRGSPAALSFIDTDLTEPSQLIPIAGGGTFGDLAVISPDGHWAFATFDAGIAGIGGVAVVDVDRREVVARWPFPQPGRPHGIAYSRRPGWAGRP